MLTGDAVALTALRHEDRDRLFEWINSPELVRLSAPFRPVHAPAHEDWFAALARDRSRVAFAIRRRADGRLIGVVQLIDIDPVHRNAEMIVRIGEVAAQNQGHGTESIRLLLDHAWRDLNLHRVTARAFASNGRAIAAYGKAGFVIEGRLREAAYIDGAWVDLVIIAALRPGG